MEVNWKQLLQTWSIEILERIDEVTLARLDKQTVQSKWLGNAPADLSDLNNLSKSTRIDLPTSIIDFYKVSDGWRGYYPELFNIYPVSKLQWFVDENAELIDNWDAGMSASGQNNADNFHDSEDDRDREPFMVSSNILKQTVLLGKGEDEQCVLLYMPNEHGNDTYNILLFSTWYPGAYKYANLYDFMLRLHSGLLDSYFRLREV